MPRASRRRGDAARRHADTIRFVLFEARPAGLLMHQLVRASGLSVSQVRSGLAALRDEAASKGSPPLIWTRQDGYHLGAERAALEAYERAVVREKLTVFRRFITGTVAPHAAAHPNDKWVRHIVAQLNSIESTLDLIASA
ncbi:RacP protein [Streptomyces agglomeratus]|uniref:RacP protein n=1 Tax=Streptomyces agglomeratus TaxID=285458 RepID=A0A1E5NY27_9ACTN|nr:RacP protein [Streptomyces agglomeratus]OEJ21156.1 RacP protein [Streptomyces agglomeratus]OEJ21208.1 RacP protein [Streptomyces agglomeratus]OEJ36595.1 RacP protein [Streptomyces agglomeratus]OEJ56313.1 RacP protein [Streptomyces agglomeratus]